MAYALCVLLCQGFSYVLPKDYLPSSVVLLLLFFFLFLFTMVHFISVVVLSYSVISVIMFLTLCDSE